MSDEQPAAPSERPAAPAPIDMERLADLVEQLMREDLRLEQARTGRRARPAGRRR